MMLSRRLRPLAGAIALLASGAAITLVVATLRAQDTTRSTRQGAAATEPATGAAPAESVDVAAAFAELPFGVGETLVYDVAVGGARVGTGRMEITGVEEIRGRQTMRAVFATKGGVLFYKVNDTMESWFDPLSMSSLRFIQDIDETGYERRREWEIYPERQILHQKGREERPSVAGPLDDASFLYFVRTIPLEVGQTYTFHRYFRPDRNPVVIKVLRRERVKVPAGEFDAIVIQPIIKSKGIFSEGGEAQMWLSDDDRRIILQLKAKVKLLRTFDLYLKSYQPPTATTTAARP